MLFRAVHMTIKSSRCQETSPNSKYNGEYVTVVTIHQPETTQTSKRSFYVCASKDAEVGLKLQVSDTQSRQLVT